MFFYFLETCKIKPVRLSHTAFVRSFIVLFFGDFSPFSADKQFC